MTAWSNAGSVVAVHADGGMQWRTIIAGNGNVGSAGLQAWFN